MFYRIFKALLFMPILFVLIWGCKNNALSPSGIVSTDKPDDNRFTKTILTKPGELNEPMAMAFLEHGRVIMVERKGDVKIFDPKGGVVKAVASIPVNTKYTSADGRVTEAEEGLMGVTVHPQYPANHWIFMYYADMAEAKHVLARWELHGDSLYHHTKKVVLEVPTQRETCCHTGGGMAWDKAGNLFLTVGNNTGNPVAGTSGLDERPGRSSWDDQRGAGSTNDLRGKILRIHPEDDGGYTIPEGNLFPVGTAKTKSEIYTMGHRNPWRVSVDNKTGYIYWGEVGPDASVDSIIGPRGYDEFNQARKAGFFGWPYFIADNQPYADYDYSNDSAGAFFDVNKPLNLSPNNTGLVELPSPQKALIWYPYGASDSFPLVGSAGRSATGGPVFRQGDFAESDRLFPAYFEGKWFIVDFMRGWIMVVTMNDAGDFVSMERFMPTENFSSAIDISFSPEGDLYVLEYGSAWFRGNDNAQLVRVEFNGGNRKPNAMAQADKTAGALPLTVNFTSDGTSDFDPYDQGVLQYQWSFTSDNGIALSKNEANPQVVFDKAGVYDVEFKVTDSKGANNTRKLVIKAGNEPPIIDFQLTGANQTFFFPGLPLTYTIQVKDKEDGQVVNGQIKPEEVSVNFDYAPEGFDPVEIAANHVATDEWSEFNTGLNMINKNDCRSCHLIDKPSVGPAYQEVAKRYDKDPKATQYLSNKIIKGGGGVWGDHAMAAHPNINESDAAKMVQYILSLNNKPRTVINYPLSGKFVPVVPDGDNGRGGYLLRAAYRDKGTTDMGSLATEKIIPLRNPAINPEMAEIQKGTQLTTTPNRSFSMVGDQAYLGFKDIDLTGIELITIYAQAQPRIGALGGVIEVRLDSSEGQIIATSDTIVPKDIDFRSLMAANNSGSANRRRSGSQGGLNAANFDFSMLRRMMAVAVPVKIKAIAGKHDIYFIFRNPDAGDSKIIVQMVEIVFGQGNQIQ